MNRRLNTGVVSLLLLCSAITFVCVNPHGTADVESKRRSAMSTQKSSHDKFASSSRKEVTVYFQAHRGGLKEVPEHTIETYRYAWHLGGIPEADIQTTKDGVIICLHDSTLARTTKCPDSIKDRDVSTLSLEEIRQWDAGIYFGEQFAGQKVLTLLEVFEDLKQHPERQLYLDLKRVDLDVLGKIIKEFKVAPGIIFAHNLQENLVRFSQIAPDVRTMLWIGGKPDEIKSTFDKARETGFEGLSQVQLHLHNIGSNDVIEYALDETFLRHALAQTGEAGIDLEVLPFDFDDTSLHRLLDLGIRWFATDYPMKFTDSVRRWRGSAFSE